MWLDSIKPIFDVISETRYELEVHPATPETSIGIGYTKDDFHNTYNNGNSYISSIQYCLGNDDVTICTVRFGDDEPYWYVLFVSSIIVDVKSQLSLVGRKTAFINVSDDVKPYLRYLNKTFKVHGFMYSPSKGCCVRWNEKGLKEKKPRVMKGVINKMKTCVLNTCFKLICEDGDIEFKYIGDIYCDPTGKILLVAFKLGYTLSDIFSYKKKGYITSTVYIHEDETLTEAINKFIPEIDCEVSWNAIHEWINEITLTK